MPYQKLTGLEKLNKLTDTLVDDILGMSDEEIIAEAKEQFSDPKAEINRVRDLLKSAIRHAAKPV